MGVHIAWAIPYRLRRCPSCRVLRRLRSVPLGEETYVHRDSSVRDEPGAGAGNMAAPDSSKPGVHALGAADPHGGAVSDRALRRSVPRLYAARRALSSQAAKLSHRLYRSTVQAQVTTGW